MTNEVMTRFICFAARRVAGVGLLFGITMRASLLAVALMLPSLSASAAPIELKLAFFASEKSDTFRYGVKPFVDAVNAEGKGVLVIKVYPNGALGKALAEQPNIVQEGVADIAWVVPGQTPYRFRDNALLELPGLFHDVREGALTFTRMIAAKALGGYESFFVIGACTAAPTIIHSRKPIGSLADLGGQKIRSNNPIGVEALKRFGALPTVMPASRIADAIAGGAIDGATLDPTGLFDFGVARATTNHYLLGGGGAPLALLMNRKKFDSLPEAAKAIIRKYSGEWAAARWIDLYGASVEQSLKKIKSDPGRKVVEPSQADRETAQRIYQSLTEAWVASSPHNRELLKRAKAELATIRATNQ